MGFAEQIATAKDPGFRDRVRMAIILAAQAIASEPSHDPVADPVHAPYWSHRHATAVAVLNDSDANVDKFAWAVAANPVITAASPDGDIQFTVNSVWDDISGAAIQIRPDATS